ncbi:hypothetical protein WA026_013544 [Henosepilachna vigintioctopunctata]|uniref:Uncharacterized protein n=1 Tax=Henosepilachna vigintioctopunctata TaxID=420089 RepID=A0AAW1V7F9_9CUCU
MIQDGGDFPKFKALVSDSRMVSCVTGIGNIEDLFSGNPGKEVDFPNQKSSSSGRTPYRTKNNVISNELFVNMKSDSDGTKNPVQKDEHSILRTDVDEIAENPSTSMSSNVTVNETNQETNLTIKLTADKSKAIVAKNGADFFKNSDAKNENTSVTQSSNTE